MRIMLDTNVLISAAFFYSQNMKELIKFIINKHTLVLSSGIIEELYRVSNYAKIPKGIDLDEFLSSIKFEYKHTTKQQVDENIKIRDIKDKRILSDALLA